MLNSTSYSQTSNSWIFNTLSSNPQRKVIWKRVNEHCMRNCCQFRSSLWTLRHANLCEWFHQTCFRDERLLKHRWNGKRVLERFLFSPRCSCVVCQDTVRCLRASWATQSDHGCEFATTGFVLSPENRTEQSRSRQTSNIIVRLEEVTNPLHLQWFLCHPSAPLYWRDRRGTDTCRSVLHSTTSLACRTHRLVHTTVKTNEVIKVLETRETTP